MNLRNIASILSVVFFLSGCATPTTNGRKYYSAPMPNFQFSSGDSIGIVIAVDEVPDHHYDSPPSFFSTGYSLPQDCHWDLNQSAMQNFRDAGAGASPLSFVYLDEFGIGLRDVWQLVYADSDKSWTVDEARQPVYDRLTKELGVKAILVIHSIGSASAFAGCSGPLCGTDYNVNMGLFTRQSGSLFGGYDHFAVRDAYAQIISLDPLGVYNGSEGLRRENGQQLREIHDLVKPKNWKHMTCEELAPAERGVRSSFEALMRASLVELNSHVKPKQ